MNFDPKKFPVYTEYCKYVWDKVKDSFLSLKDTDIEVIALMYKDEIESISGNYANNEFVKNDELLTSIIKDYIENVVNYDEKHTENLEDDSYRERTAVEKEINAHGGYGYNDSYDDFGIDERDSDQIGRHV